MALIQTLSYCQQLLHGEAVSWEFHTDEESKTHGCGNVIDQAESHMMICYFFSSILEGFVEELEYLESLRTFG